MDFWLRLCCDSDDGCDGCYVPLQSITNCGLLHALTYRCIGVLFVAIIRLAIPLFPLTRCANISLTHSYTHHLAISSRLLSHHLPRSHHLIPPSPTSGDKQETRGTAFVVYEDIYDAKNAVDHLSGFNVCGRYLIVLYYQPTKMQKQADNAAKRKELEEVKAKFGMNKDKEEA